MAFEAALRPEWNTVSLMRGVRSGTFRAASFKNVGDAKCVLDVVEEDGRWVNVIERISVDEISVSPSGSNPAAACWLGDEDPGELPAEIAEARARWAVGRQARYLAAHRGKGRAKPSPAPLASVDRCLAMAAKRTWR